jgi:hypothetical protein
MYQISVVNMSLGIYRASLTEGLAGTLCAIVKRLEAAGIVVVCAASEWFKAASFAVCRDGASANGALTSG